MTDVLVTEAVHVLTVIEEVAQVLTAAEQGPPGPPGPKGEIGDSGGALLVNNRLAEFASDPVAQTEAQTNLGFGATDPLAYYILAKS